MKKTPEFIFKLQEHNNFKQNFSQKNYLSL